MRIDSSIKDHKSSSNIMGFYPIGSRHCWHGGIHIEGNLKVRAISDGVVVAYRMPEKYIEVREEGKPEELAKKYSNGFVLIQHHYKSPKKQELIFYSLYHHLLPQKEYNSEAIPISFRKSIGYKACKGSCKKSGLQMWTGKKRGGDYIFIPNRGIVRKEPIKGDEFTPAEGYCRVVYKVKNEEIIGHVNTKCIIASYNDGKLYLINYTKDSATRSNNSNDEKYKCFGVEVWKDKEKKVLLDIVDEGTVFKEGKEDGEFIRVKLSEKGKFLIDPEDGCGYIEKKNLESNYEWNAETDKIVNCKIPVKAGDCIGYCGLYTIKDGNYRASHIEVFTDDEKNLEGFLKNTKGDDMEKVEGKEEYEISNAYIKLSGELQQSFTYKLLANTDIVCLDEKGGYYKIKIGSSEQVVCTFPDRKELLKGTNVRYKPLGKGKVTGQYHVLKDITNTNVFGGLLKEGDILDLLETQDQAKANDLDRPSECPRKVRYSYPITGKEFWVKKICIVSDSSWMDPFPGVPQISYSKLPQSKLSAEYSYSLRTTGDGGNTVDIELYPEYPKNNDLGKIEGEIILALRECEVFEQDKNQKWYYIKNKDYKDPKGNSLSISGIVDAQKIDIFPAYNWEKFGFSISKQEKDKDTYIFDFDSVTPLVKEVWSLVDEDGDKELTADEFRRAVHNKYKVDRLSKLICYHRSEWSYNDAQAWAKLENHIKSCFDKRIQKEKDSSLKAKKEKERDDKLVSYKEKFEKLGFWNEIKIDTSVEKEGETPLSPFPASPYVYHFNPIAFVEQMENCGKQWCDPVEDPQLCIFTQNGNSCACWGSFGEIRHGNIHAGIDIFAIPGTMVYACVDGVIAKVYTSGSLAGRVISLKVENKEAFGKLKKQLFSPKYADEGELTERNFDFNGDIYIVHMHLSEFLVKEGQKVKCGDPIGKSGISGKNGANFSTKNPHLHLEVSNNISVAGINGKCNPILFFDIKHENELTDDDINIQITAQKMGY